MQQAHTQHQQHHYPPPLNTSTAQQYVAYSPHPLRTPSHLTTSTSTPAMAVVSHSVDTSSPSPHSHSHSHPHSQQRVRDEQQQQQRARSYSSTQPPPALTHSTPSPLSSSSSSFSSSSSSSSTERWVRECLLKCCQLVLHNRLLLAESDHQLAVNKSFNLHTPEAGITHADWDERMRGREGDVIVLDIVLKGGGGRTGPVLLERWSLHHDMDDMLFHASPLSSSSSTATASARRVDPTIMFKRMLLLCRSMYTYVRLLPAAALAKQVHTYVEYGKSPPFTLDFSLHTASTSSPASFIATPASFNFTAVATPRGTFSVSVSYVADLSSVSISTPQRVQPAIERGEVMEDYVGHKASEAQREQPISARRQSMPVTTAYPPRAASAVPATSSSTAHSLPHTLPHQLSHRKSSRSNSHTYIDSYSPGTNTPTFTHGTPPTPSQYPYSLTDTPPFTSLPSSPYTYSTHMPHSHSSPMTIAPQPAASPISTSTGSLSPSHAAASPPIAIPIPTFSASPASASRLSSQRQSLPQTPPLHSIPATERLSSRSLTSQTPLSQVASRSRSTTGFSPVERALSTPSSRQAGTVATPTTSLSLLASSSSQQRLSSITPPAIAAHSDRNAQLGTLIQWFSTLPPLESCSTATTAADGGTVHVARMRSVSDALQQLDVLLGKSQQLKERSAAAR